MKKRLIAWLLCVVTALGTCAVGVSAADSSAELPFKDVKPKKWFYEAIKTVYDAGFMEGKSATAFEPDETMTRAELVTLLSRLAGADVSGKGENAKFADMKKKAWYTDAVGWSVENGLVNGYEDNTFRPNDPILRQELASLLIRFFEYIGLEMHETPEIDVFSDLKSIPKWARDNVEALRKTGLIKGDDAGRFNPKNTASRAEVATITMRMLDDIARIREYPLYSLKIGGTDISSFKIVYNAEPSESVLTAVEEIKKYVKLAVGVELTSEVYTSLDGNVIYLDDTAFTDDETYSLKNEGDDFIIGGSGVRGVLYGAYEFLEQCVGWRFLTDDCDYMAKQGHVNITGVDVEKTPYFIYRDPYWYSCATAYPNFAAKRKINYGTQNSPEYGGGLTDTGCHSFQRFIPESSEAQPCLSSEETYERVLAGVLAELDADPTKWCISVSQNDNSEYCTCEKCTEEIEKYGTSGQMINFVNRIAEEVEKKYPDVLIHTLAYRYTRSVPKDASIKPRDNVIVQLCSIECCFNHPITESAPCNLDFHYDLTEWAKICDKLFIWDYASNFYWYEMEIGNFDYDILVGNVRLFHECNAAGIRSLGSFNAECTTGFEIMKAYLTAKAIENPYMTEDEYNTLMEEFMKGYYGSGWESVKAYLDFTENVLWPKALNSSIYKDPDAFMLKTYKNNMELLEGYMDKAESLADTEQQAEHIRILRLQIDFFKVNAFWDEMYTNGTKQTKAEILEWAYALQANMQKYNIRISEHIGVPEFEVITRPPMEWKDYYGNNITEPAEE